MTVLTPVPQWPHGEVGKVLLHLLVDCNVDAVFEDFFGSYPELQAKLHKQRNDTNCAESPWVLQRSDLPGQQYMWPAPPAGADPGTPGQGKWRKVRFEAAASLASKAFSSEEVQTLQAYAPGSYYLVQAEVYTTAMYGDQFCIISRTALLARGPQQTQVHVSYVIHFKPSLSKFMRPMVAKGVDGGIRGTFYMLKKLLQEQYTLKELPDSAPAPELPGAAALLAAQEVPAPLPGLAVAAAPAPAAAAAASPPALLHLAEYVVYQDLVAGILHISDPTAIARGLALCMTLAMIHCIIAVFRPVSQACAAAAAGSGGGLMGLLCWPLANVLVLPDNVAQVLSALLLVAAANKLLLLGVAAASSWWGASTFPHVVQQLPVAQAVPAAGYHIAATAAQDRASGAAQQPVAAIEASAGPQTSSTAAVNANDAANKAKSSAEAAEADGPMTGSENLMQQLGNVMNGWMVSFTKSEGFKLALGGPWQRNSSTIVAADKADTNSSGQGPGSATADTAANGSTNSSSTGAARTISHRPSSSFSALMDPSGLNIIEDYAQQPEMLPQLVEEQQQQQQERPPSPEKRAAGRGGVEANAMQPVSLRPAAAAGGSAASSPASSRSASPTKLSSAAAGSSSRLSESAAKPAAASPVSAAAKPDAKAVHPAAVAEADGEGNSKQGSLWQPLLAAENGETSVSKQSPADATIATSEAAQNSRTSTPTPSKARPQSGTKSVAFNTPSPSNSRSPSRLDKAASSHAVGSAGSTGSKGGRPLARHSASPALWGNDSSREAAGGGGSISRPISRSSMRSTQSGEPGEGLGYEALSGGPCYVVPGEEEDDEIVVEVFEHERVQPFRGWGHTWPGHFLPSDKVGHWGDRSGAPGGAVSMLFDRVAPKLPIGWEWKDEEWQVDMTGADAEGCDAEGWSYGVDFSWLTWPPGPQMGKTGLKSFVRRRRWIRTRRRLPPGSFDAAAAAAAQQQALAHVQQQQQQEELGRGGSGIMAGLGAGLGLVSSESNAAAQAAAAAAASAASAASAMMNRFMRAVADLPSPTGSTGGVTQPGSPRLTADAAVPVQRGEAEGSPPAVQVQPAVNVSPAAASQGLKASSSSAGAGGSSIISDRQQSPVRPQLSSCSEAEVHQQEVGPGLQSSVQQPCMLLTPPTDPGMQKQHQEQKQEGSKIKATTAKLATEPPASVLEVAATSAATHSGEQETGAAADKGDQMQNEAADGAAAAATRDIVPGHDNKPNHSSSDRAGQQVVEPAAHGIVSSNSMQPAQVAGMQQAASAEPATDAEKDQASASTSTATASTTTSVPVDIHLTTLRSSGDRLWASADEGTKQGLAELDTGITEHHQGADHVGRVAGTALVSEPSASLSSSAPAAVATAEHAFTRAAAPAGTPIVTLRKVGSGSSGTASPRIAGGSRGPSRSSRGSSGGGSSRAGRAKLGAVSLRHNGEGPMRSTSSSAAVGSAGSESHSTEVLSPTASSGGTLNPAHSASSGHVSPESASRGHSNDASESIQPAAAAVDTTSTAGSRSSSDSDNVAAIPAPRSSNAAAIDDAAGMCEGVFGSSSPLHSAYISTAPTQQTGTQSPMIAADLAAQPDTEDVINELGTEADSRIAAGSGTTGNSSNVGSADPAAVGAVHSSAYAPKELDADTLPSSAAGDELGSGLDTTIITNSGSSTGTAASAHSAAHSSLHDGELLNGAVGGATIGEQASGDVRPAAGGRGEAVAQIQEGPSVPQEGSSASEEWTTW